MWAHGVWNKLKLPKIQAERTWRRAKEGRGKKGRRGERKEGKGTKGKGEKGKFR